MGLFYGNWKGKNLAPWVLSDIQTGFFQADHLIFFGPVDIQNQRKHQDRILGGLFMKKSAPFIVMGLPIYRAVSVIARTRARNHPLMTGARATYGGDVNEMVERDRS